MAENDDFLANAAVATQDEIEKLYILTKNKEVKVLPTADVAKVLGVLHVNENRTAAAVLDKNGVGYIILSSDDLSKYAIYRFVFTTRYKSSPNITKIEGNVDIEYINEGGSIAPISGINTYRAVYLATF